MSEDGQAIEGKQVARDVAGRFKRPDRPRNNIDKVIRGMVPNDRPATLVALFDGRASYHTVRNWRRGKNGVPQWALDLLRRKLSERLEAIEAIPRAPGRRAGWNNLGAYRAARNSER